MILEMIGVFVGLKVLERVYYKTLGKPTRASIRKELIRNIKAYEIKIREINNPRTQTTWDMNTDEILELEDLTREGLIKIVGGRYKLTDLGDMQLDLYRGKK